jgi:hypothetical protein
MARLLRRLLVIAIFGAALGAAVRALQARRLVAPAPDAGPSWPPLTPVEPEPAAGAAAGPAAAAGAAAAAEAVVEETAAGAAGGAVAWVAPVAGGCPDGYPVKANRSGIFHVPGGQFYDRTVPERCYPDPQAAEADGYRPARR